MTALIDIFPLPWARPEVRELQATLADLYPTTKAILWVAQNSGLNYTMINPEQAPFYVWYEAIKVASQTGLLRDLMQFVLDQNPRNPKAPFLRAMMQNNESPVATDASPRDASGAPKFLRSDDEVSEKEALLFHDDLTIEFGRIPWLVNVLQRLKSIGGAVCKLDTRTATQRQFGTGFRISQGLILTNWHVLNFETAATTAVAEFGYEDDGQGGGLRTVAVTCDMDTLRGDPALDWAVVHAADPLPATAPVIDLSAATEPAMQAPAFIIQHPGGQRKRVAFVRNQVTDFDERVVHYLSDTQAGSSGAPVLDENGQIVALHRAGGRPQEVAGKQPIRKNEGLRISQVIAGLERLGIQSHRAK